VINAAGEPILEPTRFWTNSFKKSVWDSRVLTNQYLINAINQMNSPKPKLFISFSGVGAFQLILPFIGKFVELYQSYIYTVYNYITKLILIFRNISTKYG